MLRNILPLCVLSPLVFASLVQAGTFDDVYELIDLDDNDAKDQIKYFRTGYVIKWAGYDAFSGHVTGTLYNKGKITYNSNRSYCDETPPSDFEATGELGVNWSVVANSTSLTTDPAQWYFWDLPAAGSPQQTKVEGQHTCATCSADGYSFSHSVTAEVEEPRQFSETQEWSLDDPNFAYIPYKFEDRLHQSAYTTNIHLWTDSYRTWNGEDCEGNPASGDGYRFVLADYSWVKQTAEFEVKGRCPGEYTLRYTMAEFIPNLRRQSCPPGGYGQFWYPCADVEYDARAPITELNRKSEPLTVKEDGSTDRKIQFPVPSVPQNENHSVGEGYQLITKPEHLLPYGINVFLPDGKVNLSEWIKYAPYLEPIACCGDDGSDSGGGGPTGAAGSGGAKNASVNFHVNLGFLPDGKAVGRLSLHSATVQPSLLTPAPLEIVAARTDTWKNLVREIKVSGVLRQIRAPQTFVDIVTTSAMSYEIRFYAAEAGGIYDPQNPVANPSGTPHTIWTVSPGGITNSVVFSRSGATPSTWEFRPTANTGTEMLRNGISEIRESTAVDGDVVEIHKITDPVYGLVSHTRKLWRYENGKIILVEDQQLGTAGQPLRGTVSDPNSYNGDKVYRVGSQDVYWPSSYSSGGTSSTTTQYADWSSYDHRSSTTGTIGDQDGDQQSEQLTTTTSYSYPSNRNSTTHVVSYSATFAHGGVNYKKEETRQAKTASSYYWDSPDKRITTRWSFADGANEGKTAWEFYPDGSATRWAYTTDTNGNTVTVHESGTPNGTQTAILYGTRSTQVEDTQGRLVSSEERHIATNLVFSNEEILERDPVHGTPTITVRNGKEETRAYSPCCGRLETITRDGLVRTILYDGLDREVGEDIHTVSGTFVSGERNEFDALGRTRKTYQRLGGTNERLIATADYDLAGKLTGTWRLGSGTVTYSETVNSSGQWVKTTSRAESASGAGDALEEVTITSGNGLPLEFRRNGVLITKWHYDYADEGYAVTEIKIGDNNSENETARSVYSMLGELVRVEYPYPQDAHSENEYDDSGRVVRQTDPDGVQTLIAYSRDADGEHVVTALDMNQDELINYGASGTTADRITKTTTTYGTRDGVTVAQTLTTQWIEDGDTPRTVSVDEMAVDGSRMWRTVLGTQTTHVHIAHDAQNGIRTETTTLPDQTQTIRTSLGDRVTSEVRKNASGDTVVSTTSEYDGYGRLWKVTDARGTTTLAYPTDLQYAVTTPAPGDGSAPQQTTYTQNDRGATIAITHPDNTTLHRQYWPDGSLKRTWGSRTYPEYHTYDRQGRMKTLTTWQDYNPASHTGIGEAVTTWNYHVQRGWLENKRYQNNQGPAYTFTAAGRPFTRTWVRTVGGQPLLATYGHNDAGEMDSIDYSDTTPDVTHTYDRTGRPLTTTDAAGKLTRSYDPATLRLFSEAYATHDTSRDYLIGRGLARTYDLLHRPQSLATDGGYSLGYGYDSAGRLEQISQGFHSAFFGYEPGTSAHYKTTIKRVGVERVRNERVFDAIGRVDLVRSVIGGADQVLRDYALNAANQRSGVELEDGRSWAYDYDSLGQVKSAEKLQGENDPASGLPLPGYSFGYTFDDIGNRIQTVTNSRATTYTPDLLNRYTSRQVAGAVDVRGEAHTDATVTVDTLSTTRTGKDFYRELPFTNSSAAVSDTVTIEASRTGPPLESATEERPVFLPQTPEVFGYDDDGNLTGDGRWDYHYDAENRLWQMETRASIAAAFPDLRKRLTFAYDAQSRRIRKLVETWNAALNSGAGGWETTTDLRFLYDGYNLLTEFDALNSNAPVRSYAWGLDLSGTLQGAGGVGGLLWANTPTHTFAASADGNGNQVAWTNTATLAVAGRADYDAFGVPVMRTGVANSLPFGFSSNYTDPETGLVYYDFIRFYHPGLGRWLSRDPIQERGGVNLYGMVGNNPTNEVDYLGLWVHPNGIVSPEVTVGTVNGIERQHIAVLNQLLSSIPAGRGAGISRVNTRRNATTRLLGDLYQTYNTDYIDGSANKWVYTCKYGWIDIGHYFNSAYFASRVGGNATYVGSVGVEVGQTLQRAWDESPLGNGPSATGESAWTPEDLNSNYQGAHSGMQIGNVASSWRSFLQGAGAVRITNGYVRDLLVKDAGSVLDGISYTGPRLMTRESQIAYHKGKYAHECLCDGDKALKQYAY